MERGIKGISNGEKKRLSVATEVRLKIILKKIINLKFN